MASDRVLVIGWDSAPHQLLFGEYLEVMPNFRRLTEQGLWGPLRSSDPPITVPAWASMTSSKNPGKLGFYGFRNRRPGDVNSRWIATAVSVHEPRVWDILSAAGKRVCVHNVPQTYPVHEVNGYMIADFLTPSNESRYTYPDSLKAEVERIADGYIIDCENFRTDDKTALLEQIYQMTDKRFRVAKQLLGRERWDFFMMVEMGSDRIQHGFWKYTDPNHRKYEPGNPFETSIKDYYAHLDAQLGELIQAFGEGSVIVVSDHGAKCMKGSLNLNDWLIREGYLRLKHPVTEVTRFDNALIDWEHTSAWAWGGYYARVFMNVKGREAQGVVELSQYESFRGELARKIAAIPNEMGEKMATRCHRPQDIYSGPYVDQAPDLMVYFDDLSWRATQDIGHDTLYCFDTEIGPDDAVHDYSGIMAVRPAGRSKAARVGNAQLMDIAPTILKLMGVEIPADFEGKPLV